MRVLRTPALGLLLLTACIAPRSPAEEAERGGVLRARVYVEADYAEVWDSLTRAPAYAAWHSAPCLAFGEAVGEPVAWGTPERRTYEGRITRLEPGAGLGHTFSFVGFGFDEETRVEIDVLARGEVVLVEVRHDCTDAPETYRLISPVGWPKSLSRLKTWLETGRAMPWPVEPGSS